MEVVRAQYAGACYGVLRALDLTRSALDEYKEINTLGPLIHNPQVVNDLQQCGAYVADSIGDITFDTVVIRSHGVPPSVRSELEKSNLNIIDATCPFVSCAQNCACELAESGCHILVVGEAGHFEVEGLVACASQVIDERIEAAGDDGNAFHQKVDVVGSVADIPDKLEEPIGIVVQTTQTQENLDAIIDALKARGIDPVVRNTICAATSQRQRSAADLATCVDAMVVVGGRNSSNTTRLAEICSEKCSQVFHVEEACELNADIEFLSGCNKVGVTAGASTPESQIQDVIEYLSNICTDMPCVTA